MKIIRIKPNNIKLINDFINELNWLKEQLTTYDIEDIEIPKNYKMNVFKSDANDLNQFLYELVSYITSLPLDLALKNLQTLLNNCADLNSDTLEFNAKIKKGFMIIEVNKE